MIRFDLVCDQGHSFDGWFRDNAAFERSVEAKALSCPHCGTVAVSKALMAPAVATSRKREEAKVTLATPDPRRQAMVEMIRKLRDHVRENADYVGDRFAEEARKIHYDEAEARSIYGEANAEEAEALAEEGIEFHPLPALPDDGN